MSYWHPLIELSSIFKTQLLFLSNQSPFKNGASELIEYAQTKEVNPKNKIKASIKTRNFSFISMSPFLS